MSEIIPSTTQAHVKGFVTSYAKCWEHYEGYMQDASHTIQGFIEACKKEADEQGVEIKLPAIKTFENRTAKLKQAGVIPERLKSDNPEAVKSRKRREKGSNPQIGEMTPTDDSSSPLITPEIVNHVTDVQQCYTSSSISGGISNVQSSMDSSSDRCDKDAVPLGTANDRRAAEDLQEIVRLLNLVGELTARNCDIRGPHFSEEQWYLVWSSLDSQAKEAGYRCKNYEAAIQRDCDGIREGVQNRFGNRMGSNAALL